MDIRIAVLQRGWVLVGLYERLGGGLVQMKRTRCIRRWGTTRGLGQLKDGPTADTILDDGCKAEWHQLSEVMTYQVDPTAWIDHLGPVEAEDE